MFYTSSPFPIGVNPKSALNNTLVVVKQMEKCLKRCQVYLWKHEIEFNRRILPVWNVNSQNRKWILLLIYFITRSAAQNCRILPLRNYLLSNSEPEHLDHQLLHLLAARFSTINICGAVYLRWSSADLYREHFSFRFTSWFKTVWTELTKPRESDFYLAFDYHIINNILFLEGLQHAFIMHKI